MLATCAIAALPTVVPAENADIAAAHVFVGSGNHESSGYKSISTLRSGSVTHRLVDTASNYFFIGSIRHVRTDLSIPRPAGPDRT